MDWTAFKPLALAVALMAASVPAWPQGPIAVTDRPAYDVGSEVRVRLFETKGASSSATSSGATGGDVVATVRYAGEQQPLGPGVSIPGSQLPQGSGSGRDYILLWRVPPDSRTGRYEIDLARNDPKSGEVAWRAPRAGSFVVYKKLVRIDEIKLASTFYTSGDAVAVSVKVSNLSDQPFTGLQVEFSDRYWPWIGPTGDSKDLHIVALAKGLVLPPHAEQLLTSARAAVAEIVKQPTVHQYAVVVWDAERQTVFDIAFSPLVFVAPPGLTELKPYPGAYPYSNLGKVGFTSYRNFYPPELVSAAIQFDRSHTLWALGSEVVVRFTVGNPTTTPWRGVSVRARLLSPAGNELRSNVVAESLDLNPDASRVTKQTAFRLPQSVSGTYRVEVQVKSATGDTLASNRLELGVNPLPKSILVFCAHEDDEMGHGGMARAAVENQIPIHYVYLTSGDAGSCDRYYQHSCSPSEALNFGALRMDEVRFAVGHLGVSPDDIYFFGLPDGGSGEIWYKHIKAANPYLDPLLATDHAPYDGLVRPNLPYARESVVEVAKEMIRRFSPDVIYTAHPPDPRHIDHRVTNYVAVKALRELLKEGAVSPDVKVLVDELPDPKLKLPPPPSTPYHYRDYNFYLSGEAKALTQEASWFYPSQGVSRPLKTFEQLPRKEAYREVLDWKEHEGWNERGQ